MSVLHIDSEWVALRSFLLANDFRASFLVISCYLEKLLSSFPIHESSHNVPSKKFVLALFGLYYIILGRRTLFDVYGRLHCIQDDSFITDQYYVKIGYCVFLRGTNGV